VTSGVGSFPPPTLPRLRGREAASPPPQAGEG
jgi:hypothetical protein